MAATAAFSASVRGKQFAWDLDQLKTSLADVASCEKKVKAITRSLKLVPRHVGTAKKHPYSRHEGARVKSTLDQLTPQVLKSGDKDLIALFHRAVANHDAIHPKQQVTPVPIRNCDYKAPDFQIPKIHLTLDVKDKDGDKADNTTTVTTRLEVRRESNNSCLVLNGRDHKNILSVRINGKRLKRADYRYNGHELIIMNVPADKEFKVRIKSSIKPLQNTTAEGLYPSNNWLVTQCESEGAQRIFFTLDRPDVLSEVTTTIIADKEKYPFRMSNGNQVGEETVDDSGRSVITWHDPFPKPSYLFAAVLGDFGVLKDTFTTRSGREVSLEIYVEHGKEERVKFAMWALKKSMEFDEKFYDREYDLDTLKVVGVPDFNAGAMENKGLLIFNDIRLLVDAKTGDDSNFKDVARVVMHEYAHNWSGNRVTVRNWFELALKEAFTDYRAEKFVEWLFGEEAMRPEQVSTIWNSVVPQDNNKTTHPIMVKEFVSPGEIYDGITYRKGREVFRCLATVCDSYKKDGFRLVVNEYFKRYDGQAVTFNELLTVVEEVMGTDVSVFRRWFHQPGTPTIKVSGTYDKEKQTYVLKVRQDCPSPIDGSKQKPFHIPLPIELVSKDGHSLAPATSHDMKSREMIFSFQKVEEKPVPVVLHGFTAPVLVEGDYSDADLGVLMATPTDSFNPWAAARSYTKNKLRDVMAQLDSDKPIELSSDVIETYRRVLTNPKLSPQQVANALQLPGVKAIVEDDAVWDLPRAAQARGLYRQLLATALEKELVTILDRFPAKPLDPYAEDIGLQFQVRELRTACMAFLAHCPGGKHIPQLIAASAQKDDFNERINALRILASTDHPARHEAFAAFEADWAHDLAVYNHYLGAYVRQRGATTKTVEEAMASKGYNKDNKNHVWRALMAFTASAAFHDSEGVGYRFVADQIMALDKVNSHTSQLLTKYVWGDYDKLPATQQELMREQLERLAQSDCSKQVRGQACKHLGPQTVAKTQSSSSAASSSSAK